MKTATTKLTDSYIRKLLKAQFKRGGEPDKNVEPWRIGSKRNQLLEYRALKEAKKIIKEAEE